MTDSAEKLKRPASQYYWGEYLNDKALQTCPLAARGLWHEMNCLMHQGEPYGHLTVNGKPMKPAQLANLTRITERECKKLLAMLEDAGIFSVAESGAMYSRRMVKDEAARENRVKVGKENGEKGKEFGALGASHGAKGGRPRGDGNPGETPPNNPREKPPQNPLPSSSSSSSSSPSDKDSANALVAEPPASVDLQAVIDGVPALGSTLPPCPHDRVLALWQELAPEFPQPAKWNDKRQALLRMRWRETAVEEKWTTTEDGLRYFAKLFRWVKQSKFLSGKSPAGPGRQAFVLDLEWLFNASNWLKVIEGKYHTED